jgi:hypothetical protein
MKALGFEELSPEERGSFGGRVVKERVYEAPVGAGRIRVYSSVVGPTTRDRGRDAIRVQYWIGDQKIYSAKRVHRTQNWRKNLLRRTEEVRDLIESGPLSRIPTDSRGDLMTARRSRLPHERFWGSVNYPEIRETRRFEAASVLPRGLETEKTIDKVMAIQYLLDDSAKQQKLLELQTALKMGLISEDEILEALDVAMSRAAESNVARKNKKQELILEHLSKNRQTSKYDGKFENTEGGIVELLGITRTGVSKTLRDMEAAGLLYNRTLHVPGFRRKVQCWFVVGSGIDRGFGAEALVRHDGKWKGIGWTPEEEASLSQEEKAVIAEQMYEDWRAGLIEATDVDEYYKAEMIYVRQMGDADQARIENELRSALKTEFAEMPDSEIESLVELGMDSKLSDLSDVIDIEDYEAESFKPPAAAIAAAKKGLEQRKKWGRGGLSPSEAKAQGIDSGVTRARKIASGKVSEHDVRRMSAFNRHRKNNRPDKKMPDGGPTAGTIAWNLWGGTAGVNWAKKKSAALGAEEKLSKTSCCCGATEANPCACMKAPEPMNCSAIEPKCPCYAAKSAAMNAETFEAEGFGNSHINHYTWSKDPYLSRSNTLTKEGARELLETTTKPIKIRVGRSATLYVGRGKVLPNTPQVISRDEALAFFDNEDGSYVGVALWEYDDHIFLKSTNYDEMWAETFEAYDVASWNPADEPTEEEAVWEQFYEYCPDKELVAKLWDLEGQPGDSAESWMDSLEGTDEHENVFERHYELIKEAAFNWWDSMYDAMSQEWENERESREKFEEHIARLMEDPEYTTLWDSEGLEKDRNSSAFEDWELKHLDCLHDWQDEELHTNLHDELYQITAYCPKCDATLHIIPKNSQDSYTLPGRRSLEDFYDQSPLMAFPEGYSADFEYLDSESEDGFPLTIMHDDNEYYLVETLESESEDYGVEPRWM